MATDVFLTQTGPVARIRFETPNQIHILSTETRKALSEILAKLKTDDGCRIVIFEARGKTFLAGADLAELQGLHQDSALWFAEAGQKLMNEIAGQRAITLCAIQAACAGGGCELALACDFRLASAGARIGLPETSLGLIPGWGGTVRSTLLLGAVAARRMILTAELLPAEEALRLGLVDRIFDDADFEEAVERLVEQLLTRAPQALKRAKRLISQITRSGFKKALAREARQFAACYASGEPALGIAAFKEKRAPSWTPSAPADTSSPTVELKPKRKKITAGLNGAEVDADQPATAKRERRAKPKPE